MTQGPFAKLGLSRLWIVLAAVGGILLLGDLNRRMADARRLERDAIVLQTETTALETQQEQSREQVDLFAPPPQPEAPSHSAVEAAVAALDPDALSPREALDALYQLKRLGKKS